MGQSRAQLGGDGGREEDEGYLLGPGGWQGGLVKSLPLGTLEHDSLSEAGNGAEAAAAQQGPVICAALSSAGMIGL